MSENISSPATQGTQAVLPGKRRFLVADDHPLVRQALCAVISRLWPTDEIEESDTLESTMAALHQFRDVELVILDLKMPDCSGFTGLLSLRSMYPHVPVVIISASSDPDIGSASIHFGASGFLPKSAAYAEIAGCLTAVLEGDIWAPANIAEKTTVQSSIGTLTATELRILSGLHRGLVNKEIALQLDISRAGVKFHLTNMFRKLGVVNRTQAAVIAEALDLPSEP